jgi:nucleoside-triphosphatase THEP1
MEFKRAEKSQSKLRAAIFGPPGSGKTMTALRMATGMGGKIALIDSEHKTASKYSDRYVFDVINLENKSIEEYTEAIKTAEAAGYPVLVIDSLSHAWQELVEEIEKLAKDSFNKNTFRAWAVGTPKQRDFTETILKYPGHIIATMRSKIEYSIEKDDKGRTVIEKKGLAPEQGKAIEYEFDLLMELTQTHQGFISKDRSGKYQDKNYDRPGEELGKELAAWLSEGKPYVAPERTPEQEKAYLIDKCKVLAITLDVAKMKTLDITGQIAEMKALITAKEAK